MKKTIKLTEAKLKRIISEAIEDIMNDFDDTDRYEAEDEFRQNFNFGDEYEFEDDYDPESYMLNNCYDRCDGDLSDGDLYRYGY